MYKRQVGARAADGIASHGSLDAYVGDFHACSKAFEMFVADRLSGRACFTRRLPRGQGTAATRTCAPRFYTLCPSAP
jgi:hypothetical protein